jgi:hypothetical protein
MASLSSELLENSIKAALASIEIYNKPDFKYREQSFTILNVNAWELLLKAKLVKDAGEDVACLYVQLPDGSHKKNRSGNPLTIDVNASINKIALDATASENIKALIEIRDSVTHFFYDEALVLIIFSLGVASLKNYQKLVKSWFNRSLLEYNFHILPLAFSYDFRKLSMLELEDKPEAEANVIRAVVESHENLSSDDFHFVCEVTTEIRSAKKFSDGADFVSMIDSNASPGTAVFIKLQNLHDKYPLSFTALTQEVKKIRPDVNENQIKKFMKANNMKANEQYSHYVFGGKWHEDRYRIKGILPKMILSIYNYDAVRFIAENL